MGKILGNNGAPPPADLPSRSGVAQKRPRSQLSNRSGGGGGPRINFPPSPPGGAIGQGGRPLSWPPLYLGPAASAGPGGGHVNGASAAAVNLSESLYSYAASPHQSSRFSQVLPTTTPSFEMEVPVLFVNICFGVGF